MKNIDPKQISTLEPFREFQAQELDALVKLGQSQEFAPDEIIFEEGDEGNEFYLIISGVVTISMEGKDKGSERIELGIRKWGEIFGEMAILDQLPRSARATAQTDTLLLSYNRENFIELMHNYPSFFISILKLLSLRVREAMAAHDK